MIESAIIEGIKTVFHHNNSPITHIAITCGVGSSDEDETNRGISHLLEHSMFLGSTNITKSGYWEEADKIGARLNAYTTTDHTMFHISCVTDKVGEAFRLVADPFTDAQFPEDEFTKEKGIIIDEINRGLDDNWDYFYRQLYGKCFDYSIIGDKHIVEGANVTDIKNWRDLHFRADNIVVTVTGDLDFETVAALVADNLIVSRQPYGFDILRPILFAPTVNDTFKKSGMNEAYFIYGQEIYPQTHSSYADLVIMNHILGGSGYSKLFRRLRDDLGMVYGVSSSTYNTPHFDFLHITTSCSEDNVMELKNEILQVIEEMPDTITKEEVDAAKASYLSSLLHGQETSTDINVRLAIYYIRGLEDLYLNLTENIENVRIGGVKQVAKDVLSGPKYTAIMRSE